MKKYLLIGLLFALGNGFTSLIIPFPLRERGDSLLYSQRGHGWLGKPLMASVSNIISAQATGTTKTDAEHNAQNLCRRNLLIYLTNSYRDNLGLYYLFYSDSKQNINKDLIDELILSAKQKTTREGGQYKCVMSISQQAYSQTLLAYQRKKNYSAQIKQNYDQYISDGNLYFLLLAIDTALQIPNEDTLQLLDNLAAELRGLKTQYHDKYLVYGNAEQEIVINTPEGLSTVLDFRYGEKTVTKTTNSDNEIIIKVSFSGENADFKIARSISDIEILFAYDIEKTFRLNSLNHTAFFKLFIETFFSENAGKISVLQISESRFFVTSENYKKGIGKVNDFLKQKGWSAGNSRNYTHRIVLSCVVSEQKLLNAGVYYIKAYAMVEIFDRQRVLIQSNKSAEVEMIEMSAERCREKVEEQLLERIRF